VIFDARVPLALGASLLLHGAALALADRLPVGWQRPPPEWDALGAGVLQARLRQEETAPREVPARVSAPAPRAADPARRGAPAPLGALPLPRYLPAAELDERPQIRSHVEPAFPLDANAPTGRVVLRLLISESGSVDKVEVVRAEPQGPFETAAVEAFSQARFSPGRKDGAAVKSALTLDLRFGEAPAALAELRRQDVPLFQAPRQAPRRRNASAQERP
jgi:TonB family protein